MAAAVAVGPLSAKLTHTVPAVICGCVDIGTNTTRLLVAGVRDGRLDILTTERSFTSVGAALGADGSIAPGKAAELAAVAADFAGQARRAGCERVAVVATAAVRGAPNSEAIVAALGAATGIEPAVLSGEEEARLSFHGATNALERDGRVVAAIDVGGGSTEVAVGRVGDEPGWCRSLPIGSGVLTERCVRSDPPDPADLERIRAEVRAALAALDAPRADAAVAVGGTATSLALLGRGEVGAETLSRSFEVLGGMSCAEAGEHFGINPARVRLLPAGIAILAGVADQIGLEPRIVGGGLREGVVLALARGDL